MKIEKIKLVDNQDIICEAYFDDGSVNKLSINSFSNRRMKEDLSEIESYSIRQCENVIVIIALLASRQGGFIIVWDCFKNRVLHISEGAFTCYATIFKNQVFSFRLVSTFMHAPEFGYTICPLETNDPYSEYEFQHLNLDPNTIDNPFEQCRIDIVNNKIRFVANGQAEEITI